jgi:Na+-driven multidrug efflux pump
MVSIFYALVPISDRAKALEVTTFSFLKAAGVFGIALAGLVACIPATRSTCGRLFSSDPDVVALVNSLVPIQIIYSLFMAFFAFLREFFWGRMI